MAQAIPDYPDSFVIGGVTSRFNFKGQTPGAIIGGLLPYVYVIAGLLLLIMLIVGGITLMTAMGDPAKTKDGYGKITAGLIGFLIIFVSYMVVQILQVVLGIAILQ